MLQEKDEVFQAFPKIPIPVFTLRWEGGFDECSVQLPQEEEASEAMPQSSGSRFWGKLGRAMMRVEQHNSIQEAL